MTDHSRLSGRSLVSLAALGILVILAVVLYGRGGGSGNQASAECAGSTEISAKIARVALGGVAALQAEKAPRPLPDFPFSGPNGPISPKDFRGKPYLFNVWATWCVPCREEMPVWKAMRAKHPGVPIQSVADLLAQAETIAAHAENRRASHARLLCLPDRLPFKEPRPEWLQGCADLDQAGMESSTRLLVAPTGFGKTSAALRHGLGLLGRGHAAYRGTAARWVGLQRVLTS